MSSVRPRLLRCRFVSVATFLGLFPGQLIMAASQDAQVFADRDWIRV